MGALLDAVTEFRTALGNDAVTSELKRSSTALPTEQINEWPIVFVYPAGPGAHSFASQTSRKAVHTVRVAIHSNRQTKGLDGAIAELLTYADDVPRVLYAAWDNSQFAGTVSMFGNGTSGSPQIRTLWEPDKFGDIDTYSVKFDCDIRIHEED